jgi:hypothetical protein
VKGKVFAVISATGSFDIELDNDGKQSMVSGRKISGEAFKRVRFYNTSGASNTITYYAGNDDIELSTPISADGSAATATIVPEAVSSSQFLKTSSAPGTPVALTAAATYFQHATIIARKSLDGASGAGANAGNVVIGASATANQQPLLLAPGDEVTVQAPVGKKRNFSNWYLDVANSGDGVVVIYS